MIARSKELKAQGKPYSIVFTGAQYEGLVVFYNTLVNSMGGHILSEDGKSVVLDEGAVQALALLKEVTSSGITDPSLTNSKEDDVRQAFQRGDGRVRAQLAVRLRRPTPRKSRRTSRDMKWAVYPEVEGGHAEPRPRSAATTWPLGSYSRAQARGVRSGAVPAQRGEPEVLRDQRRRPADDRVGATTTTRRSTRRSRRAPTTRTWRSSTPMRDSIIKAIKDSARAGR